MSDSVLIIEMEALKTLIPLLFFVLKSGFWPALAQHSHNESHQVSLQRDWSAPMEIDVRSMHRYCSGECFYLPEECVNTLEVFNCSVIVSIKKYDPSCEHPEKSGTVDLCKRRGHLFIITLLRNLETEIIRSSDRDRYKTHGNNTFFCRVEPFVAISFTDNEEETMQESDVENGHLTDMFFPCVGNYPYVTSWIKPKEPPPLTTSEDECLPNGTQREFQQLMGTRPYPPMGSSVMWSKIDMIPSQYAMGCKFIISDLEEDRTITLGKEDVIMGLFGNRKLKVATGMAFVREDVIEDVVFSHESTKVRAISDTLEDYAHIYVMEGMTNWDSASMDLPTLANGSYLRHQKNQIALQEMGHVYDMCRDNSAMCFTRNDEQSCIYRKKCHYLAAIESLDRKFSTLRIYIIAQLSKRLGVNQKTHPQHWAAIGFSNDTKMGRDLVFSCAHRGIYDYFFPSYNADQNNIIPTAVDWDKNNDINAHLLKNYLNMDTESSLCIFDVETNDKILRAFFFSNETADPEDEKTWATLHWYFKTHEFYVLIAQGGLIYSDKKLSYHTHRGVSKKKFSRKLYWEYVNGQSQNECPGVLFHTCLAFLYCLCFIHNHVS